MSDRQKYYVSVQSGSMLTDQGAASYELEIYANDQDIEQLEDMFDEKMNAEDGTASRAILPGIPQHISEEDETYDYVLAQIYKKLHELGTDETKRHIESMGILDQASSPAAEAVADGQPDGASAIEPADAADNGALPDAAIAAQLPDGGGSGEEAGDQADRQTR